MSYGTETPGERSYHLQIQSVATVGSYPLTVNCSFDTEQINDDTWGSVFQDLVDLIADSATFNVSGASRTRVYSESVTPTP